MFEELRIENFQAHVRFRIKFHPNVTTIVGPSDRGKSAILRALRWMCLNDLRGDAFIRDGADFVRVSLLVDGEKISRMKTGGSNVYTMGDETFAALRSDVPEAIRSVLNVDVVNFQSQHDSPFWLTLPPGQVSRELNAIVDLSVMDTTLRNLNRLVSDHKTNIDLQTKQMAETKGAMDCYSRLDEMVSDFSGLEVLEEKKTQVAGRVSTLSHRVLDLDRATQDRDRHTQYTNEARDVWKLGDTAAKLEVDAGSLRCLIEQHDRATLASHAPDFSAVEAAMEKLTEATTNAKRLDRVVRELTEAMETTNTLKQQAKLAHDELEQACDGICPLCQQPLP